MKVKNRSKKRDAILEKLRSTDCHPSADWLLQELREDYPDMSLATVYRNLALFKEEGDAISVGVVDGKERFDGQTHSHAHFVCRNCNAVHDIDLEEGQVELSKQVKEFKNYQIQHLECTAYGLCDKCLN